MSVESGFSTFRGANGMWNDHKVEDVATPEGFYRNPKLVIDFYNSLYKQLLSAEPNKGHRLIAELEKDYEVVVVTQNVDNLHERAGSTHVIHLHGELTKGTSSRNPNDPRCICELKLGGIQPGDLAADGSPLRPFIVWFGEAVPEIETAAEYCMQADIFVIVGTSLNVYPAAGLVHYVKGRTPIYLIDPETVNMSYSRYIHVIRKGASAGMEELLTLLDA